MDIATLPELLSKPHSKTQAHEDQVCLFSVMSPRQFGPRVVRFSIKLSENDCPKQRDNNDGNEFLPHQDTATFERATSTSGAKLSIRSAGMAAALKTN